MLGALVYGFLYYILLPVFRLLGWWRVEGLEHLPPRNIGGMIVAMNHIHWIDIPVIGKMLPWRYRLSWLGKSEIFANPISAWFFTAMKVIPIKRGKRDLAALDAAVGALKNGVVLLVFPEGHRSRNGILQAGRGGTVRMAMQAGVPIVPVAVTGTEHGLKGVLRGERVLVRIGRPYTVAPTPDGKIPPEMMDQLTTDLMTRIAILLPEEQRGPYRELVRTTESLNH